MDEIIPYVAMAWARAEHDDAEAVLDGCLLVVANTHEEAYDEIVEAIRSFGDDEENYVIVVRRAE